MFQSSFALISYENYFSFKLDNLLKFVLRLSNMSLFLHQIWRNVALHHLLSQQWMLCSEWVPSEWESDKNITIIHTSPVHQLMSWEDKSWNKSVNML